MLKLKYQTLSDYSQISKIFSGSNSYTIFDCFFSVEAPNGQLYPSEPIHNLQRMERKVLLALSEIKDIEIRQRHG